MKTKRKLAIMLVCAFMVSLFSGMNFQRAKADVPDTVSTLTLDGTWTSDQWITETTETNYYKIVIPSDGELELNVMYYMSIGYVLYDQDLSSELFDEAITWGTEENPRTESHSVVLSAGTYYLGVWGEYGTGRYKISAEHTSYGVNDQDAISYDSPQEYSLNTQITGALTETDKEDWYKITISDAARYIINMQSYIIKYTSEGPKGANFKLYNQDLSQTIFQRSVAGGDTYSITDKGDAALEKGTYYLKVSGDDGATGKYAFSMEKLTQSNCNHDYKSTKVNSTYIAKGYTLYKCSKCGHSYKDDYTDKKILAPGEIYVLEPSKKSIKVSFRKVYYVSGYQIRYSTNKKFKKSVKTVKAGKNANNKVIKKLKRKKKYYVQVRGYKKVNGTTVYGLWSHERYAKTK